MGDFLYFTEDNLTERSRVKEHKRGQDMARKLEAEKRRHEKRVAGSKKGADNDRAQVKEQERKSLPPPADPKRRITYEVDSCVVNCEMILSLRNVLSDDEEQGNRGRQGEEEDQPLESQEAKAV